MDSYMQSTLYTRLFIGMIFNDYSIRISGTVKLEEIFFSR